MARSPKLPTELLTPSDPLYGYANYADSMIRLTRWLRRLAIPIGCLVAGLVYAAVKLVEVRLTPISILIGLTVFVILRTRVCRVPWAYDFRPPILVLRSHKDERIKHGGELPPDDLPLRQGGRNSYIWQLSHALWDWCRIIMLQEEFPESDLDVNAVVVDPSDDWETVVSDIARQSWIILIFPSSTDGCLRELKLLRSDNYLLSKTVVFMPPSESNKDKFLRKALGYGKLRQADNRSNWESVRKELAESGYQFPPYSERGLFFIPSQSFSISRSLDLNHDDFSWHRLLELVPEPGLSAEPLWNIACHGNAFESVDRNRARGGVAADSFTPGYEIIHGPCGTIVRFSTKSKKV